MLQFVMQEINSIFRNIKVIAFDADDTLWENENFFRAAEQEFYSLMKNFADKDFLEQKLFQKEVGHLGLYGYGIKSFTLSMIETALEVSKHKVSPEIISQIITIGKKMLAYPVRLLDDVEKTLEFLKSKGFFIIVATKGDLIDQERKLKQSGLLKYFNHIEVMTDKQTENYKALFKKLNIVETEFLIIGNSLKSDIIPVVKLGGKAIHIPYHTTWVHEEADKLDLKNLDYLKIKKIGELIKF